MSSSRARGGKKTPLARPIKAGLENAIGVMGFFSLGLCEKRKGGWITDWKTRQLINSMILPHPRRTLSKKPI